MNGRLAAVLLLTLAVGLMEASASVGGSHHRPAAPVPSKILLMNNLLDELDDSLPQCSAAFRRVQEGERSAHSPYPPDVKGSWVSQECETRPGPEFLLRHYQFERDGSFKLLQHFYGDEWCTTPIYTLSARGHLQLREPSWVVPGAAEAEYTLHRVTIVAYSEDVVDQVMQRVNRSCPGFINRPWRVRKEYLVYSYGSQQGGEVDRASSRPLSVNKQRHGNIHHGNGSSMKKTTNADLRSKRVSHNGSHYNVPTEATQQTTTSTSSNNDADEIDCLSAFHAVYHELQLVRSVRRSRDLVQQNTDSKTTQEVNFLFLGDVHPQLEQRASYRPTSYQPPLIRHHHEGSDCHICRLVAKSSDKSPPHLHARPRLPVYPLGDWTSSTCETRPLGTFLMRRMKFTDHNTGLNGFYGSGVGVSMGSPTFQALFHYFADPSCSRATMTVLARGHYSSGSDSNRVQGATEFDFYVQSVSITVHDESTANNLNGLKGNQCGMDGSWKVGRPQDVTVTGGCLGLGIHVPTVANDLLKMDLNGIGHPLLYFGFAENPSVSEMQASPAMEPIRPTSYLPPLQQCHDNREELSSVDDDTANELTPLIPHARIAGTSSSTVTASHCSRFVSLFVATIIVYKSVIF